MRQSSLPASGHLASLLLLILSPVMLSAETGLPGCPEDAEGKDGLCGHALAAAAKFEQDGTLPPPYIENGEGMDDTDITHCHLDIEVDPIAKTVAGTNTLSVISRTTGLTQITLDLRSNMAVDSVLVNGAAATFTRPTHEVRIDLDGTYDPGEGFEVQVTYHGTPSNLNWGSFEFGSHGGTAIVASLSEPWYAHTWWPCKEAIHDKFTMDTWVTVPDWMTVASNGRLLGTDSLTGSRQRFRWQESYPISVYLVSVAMTNYAKTTDWYVHSGGTMPVEFYLYPEDQNAVLPLLTGPAGVVAMIETFSAPGVFGEYPFIEEKYGIAQFEWCCGMEHQTITSQGSFPERRTVHELAHSWWGNNVTCKTWHDIWLNEGFARYAEALWHEKRPGGSHSLYLNHLQEYRPIFNGENGTVYRYDISTPTLIFSSTYSYDKGAWVMHMLRHVLGDAVFFQTLWEYRQTFTGGAADTEDFKTVAETVWGEDLDWFFSEWVYQNGAPSYRYGWQSASIGGQQWARVYIQQHQSYPNFKMPIDVTVWTASGSETQVVWQEADEQWYLLPSDELVTNIQLDRDIWILRGDASPVAYAGGPPKLVAATPGPGTSYVFDPQISAVDLQFSEAVTYAAGDFSVTGSDTGPVPFTIDSVPSEYRLTLSFASPLPAGETWTVRVADTLQSQAAGLGLDGELSGMLPSGDGIPGGAAEFSFTVGPPLPPCPDPFADADDDGDVDQVDFGILQTCFTGEGDPASIYDVLGCHCWDHDGDDDVDGGDLDAFIDCTSGPSIPADANCDD